MSCLSFLCELHCLRYKEHIFDKVFKVIRDCPGFDLLRSVIGPENLHCFLNQSDEKREPITGFRQLVCFKCKFLLSFSSLLIGCFHYFLGFVFTILILKPTLRLCVLTGNCQSSSVDTIGWLVVWEFIAITVDMLTKSWLTYWPTLVVSQLTHVRQYLLNKGQYFTNTAEDTTNTW